MTSQQCAIIVFPPFDTGLFFSPSHPVVQFNDSSSDDELDHELENAAQREKRKNPHALSRQETGVAKPLFSSSSDSDDEKGRSAEGNGDVLHINSAYAAKYDAVKRQKELHSLTSKYGKRAERLDEESEEDEEDDEAVLLTREKEIAFAKALYALRHPEAASQKEERFFAPPEDQLEDNSRVFIEALEKKRKTRKGHTLADEYQRAVAHSAAGVLPEDLGSVENTSGSKRLAPRTAQEKALRDAFLRSAEEIGDFSASRKDTEDTAARDDRSAKPDEVKHLLSEAFDASAGTNDDEAFIRSYFLNELWRPDENAEDGVDYQALAEAEEQELFYDDAEVWEHKFQENKYRHEEALEEAARVQTFPRAVGDGAEGLLRKQDTSRKDARQRRIQRMADARQKQVEELKRLKHLKRQEIDQQRALIASVSGLTKGEAGSDLDEEDAALARLKEVWSEKDFEAPFDPEEFDKKMAAIFNDEYYREDNVDDDEIQFMEAELDGDVADGDMSTNPIKDVLEEPELFKAKSLEEAKKYADPLPVGAGSEDPGDAFSLLYPSSNEDLNSTTFQKQSIVAEAKGNKELLEKLQQELKEKEEAYINLHHNADAMPFRYREVPPEDFTLSVEEILARDDRQLNMIAPMNCYAAYLDKASNERDRRRIERRRTKGFREINADRSSRRYGDVKKTAVLDDSISEKEGQEIAERLRKRIEEVGAERSVAPLVKRFRNEQGSARQNHLPQRTHEDQKACDKTIFSFVFSCLDPPPLPNLHFRLIYEEEKYLSRIWNAFERGFCNVFPVLGHFQFLCSTEKLHVSPVTTSPFPFVVRNFRSKTIQKILQEHAPRMSKHSVDETNADRSASRSTDGLSVTTPMDNSSATPVSCRKRARPSQLVEELEVWVNSSKEHTPPTVPRHRHPKMVVVPRSTPLRAPRFSGASVELTPPSQLMSQMDVDCLRSTESGGEVNSGAQLLANNACTTSRAVTLRAGVSPPSPVAPLWETCETPAGRGAELHSQQVLFLDGVADELDSSSGGASATQLAEEMLLDAMGSGSLAQQRHDGLTEMERYVSATRDFFSRIDQRPLLCVSPHAPARKDHPAESTFDKVISRSPPPSPPLSILNAENKKLLDVASHLTTAELTRFRITTSLARMLPTRCMRGILVAVLLCMVCINVCGAIEEYKDEELQEMDLEELKSVLHDMSDKTTNIKKHKTKEEVIKAIHNTINQKKENAKFEVLVNASVHQRSLEDGDHLHSVHIQADRVGGLLRRCEQLKTDLQNTFPNHEDIELTCESFFAPPTTKSFLSSYMPYAFLILIIFGEHLPFVPGLVRRFLQRHRALMFSTVTMVMMTTMNRTPTPTFEVFVDDKLVYSGISRGMPPSPALLRQLVLTETLLRDYPWGNAVLEVPRIG
eukprot:gene5539-3995_t